MSVRATYADLARLLAGERPSCCAPQVAASDWPTVGVAGARGVVGGAFLSILADAGLPPARCAPSAPRSEPSATAMDRCPPVRSTSRRPELDVLFLATDGATSRQIAEGPDGPCR